MVSTLALLVAFISTSTRLKNAYISGSCCLMSMRFLLSWQQFNKEPGKVVDEFKLRVVYVPTTTPSPIPEDSDLGSSAYPFSHENGINNSAMPQSVRHWSVSVFCLI
jgi:hypothetical protein